MSSGLVGMSVASQLGGSPNGGPVDLSMYSKHPVMPNDSAADFAAAVSRQSSIRSAYQGDEACLNILSSANVMKQLMDAAAEDVVSVTGKECRSVLARVKRSIDDMFAECASNWCSLGLTAGDVTQRATALEAAIYHSVRPYLNEDRVLVEEVQRTVLEMRCECSQLAVEADDACVVSELSPLYVQLEDLKKEKVRLKNTLDEQERELAVFARQLPQEAQKMGLDPRQYAIGSDLSGAHGLNVAKNRLNQIQQRQEERIADARRALENISHMQSQMNMQLKFVEATDDEHCIPNLSEGVILLPYTDRNAMFVRFVHDCRWDCASRNDMLDPKYFLNLMRLEKEYTDFIQKRKRHWQAGFDRAYVNKMGPDDNDTRELEIANDPFTYAARLKGEEADAQSSLAMLG